MADSTALASLRYQWRALERGERGLDEASFEKALVGWMAEHRSSHVPFLASREGTPIGMAWLAVVERIPGPEFFARRSAYIQSTYVVAEERSAGVGSELVRRALEHARELRLDYVAVHPSERAFSLYKRVGFSKIGNVMELRL